MAPASDWPESLGPSLAAVATIAVVGGALALSRRAARAAELRRLLTGAHSHVMTAAAARWLAAHSRSVTVPGLRVPAGTSRVVVEASSDSQAASALARAACPRGADPSVLANALACVRAWRAYENLLQALDALAGAPFDSGDAAHEAALEGIWRALCPGKERQGGRISRDWEDIGFQGTDPATDFRGMGALGLRHLADVARRRGAFARGEVAAYAADAHRHFPLAITSINCSGWLRDLAQEGTLAPELFQGGCAMEAADEVHGRMLEAFARLWREKRPKTVMDFGEVQGAFMEAARAAARRGEPAFPI